MSLRHNGRSILLVASRDFRSQYGGGQVYVRSLAEELCRRGYRVAVAWFESGSPAATETYPVGPNRSIALHRVHAREGEALEAARAIIPRLRPHLVHAHGWKAEFSQAAFEQGIACVVTAHHGGIVCPSGALLDWRDKLCSLPVSEETCRPCCVRRCPGGRLIEPFMRHLPMDFIRWANARLGTLPLIPFIKPAVHSAIEPGRRLEAIRKLALPGTILVAPSKATAAALLRNQIPKEQVAIVPHGIEPFPRTPLRPGLGGRPLRFVYVGRISPVKGLHILLRALGELDRPAAWELDIVGAAETKPEIRYRRRIESMRVDQRRIRWRGRAGHERVSEVLADCDVLVLPSICHEVFGLVILEAHSTGRPVVASRSGGPEDIVRDGENGILVEPGDVGGWTRALGLLIDEPEKVAAMAANIGRVRTMEEHVSDLEAVYDRAAELRMKAGKTAFGK